MWLDAPLYVGLYEIYLPPPEKWIRPDLPPILLPGRDNDGSLRVPGGHDGTHRVSRACSGMQIYERRLLFQKRVADGLRDHGSFLESQNVLKVLGKILQEWKLRGTRVAEKSRHPVSPKDLKDPLAHARHGFRN